MDNIFTFLVGGKAGAGVKKAGAAAARLFAQNGLRVFQMDDYQSLIKGGHNFSVISCATRPITSQHDKADLAVALDKRSYDLHARSLTDQGVIMYNSDAQEESLGIGLPILSEARKFPNPELRIGVAAIAILAAGIGLSKDELRTLIGAEYVRDRDINTAYAQILYDLAFPKIGGRFTLAKGNSARPIRTGNEMLALGLAAAGLDLYYSYPMTPSSPILHYLAAHAPDLGLAVIHPENEIAVINMALGSVFAGCRAAVGSSGGGFALMEEAFSMAGMVEAPILCVLASRPGPSTGLPTYTAQGDLDFALNQGHGEFPRIVAAPGDIEESFYLAAQLLDLVWRFQTPGILLMDKHIGECGKTIEPPNAGDIPWLDPDPASDGMYQRYLDTPSGVSPLLFPPDRRYIRWNSYEHDELGITTEDPIMITRMQDKRMKKGAAIAEFIKGLHTVNISGTKDPVIVTYGSVTMSVREALICAGLEATVVQPLYLAPLPVWELAQLRDRKVIVVEQSAGGQFSTLLQEKTGIKVFRTITKYDGRPFDPEDLARRIKEVARG